MLLYITGDSPSGLSIPLTYSVFGSVGSIVIAEKPSHPLMGGLVLLNEAPMSVLLSSNSSKRPHPPSIRAVKA